MRPVDTPEILLKSDKIVLVMEGIGEGRVRVTTSSWPDGKVMLAGQVIQVKAETSKQLCATRQADPYRRGS
jgi:hypothetical protein